MSTPNYPQQPGPYGPPPGGQPQPYGQQPLPYTPPGGAPQQGYPGDPYAQQPQPGPYGPQPGMGQPGMGQPGMGQPGPYGPPPGAPMGQPMPYAPAPSGGGAGKAVRKIIGSIVVLVLVAGGFFIVRSIVSGVSEPSAQPGDCAKVTGTTMNPVYKKVDCSSAEANYIIAKAMKSTSEACPGKDYAEYTESSGGGRRRSSSSLKLCMVEKWEEGKCYEDQIGMSMEGAKPIDCSKGKNKYSTTKPFKVDKVVKAATADCGESSAQSYTDPAPGLTYCLSPLAEK